MCNMSNFSEEKETYSDYIVKIKPVERNLSNAKSVLSDKDVHVVFI